MSELFRDSGRMNKQTATRSTRRRASLGAAGLTVGIAGTMLVGAPPANAAVPQAGLKPGQTRVFVEGDSLTVGARPYINRMLRPRVGFLAIDAAVGRPTRTGISKLNSQAAKIANVWVIGLGTNDGPDPVQTRANVYRVMQMAAGKKRIVWVNVVRPGGYGQVNVMLRNLGQYFPNLTILNWAWTAYSNRSIMAGDGVHLTASGYQLRAALTTVYALRVARR